MKKWFFSFSSVKPHITVFVRRSYNNYHRKREVTYVKVCYSYRSIFCTRTVVTKKFSTLEKKDFATLN